MIRTLRFMFFFLVCALVLPSSFVQAGEIININNKYKIAFSDLTENDVKAGDLVAVTTPDGMKAVLKVLETYPVMIKLTTSDGEGALTDEQFARITVGSQVISVDKAGKAGHSTTPAAKPPKPPKPVATVKQPVAPESDEMPSSVESYSPGSPAGTVVKAPVGDVRKPDRQTVIENSPASAPTRAIVPVVTPPQEKAAVVVASSVVQLPSAEARSALLDQRLDQMMANNVKLAESITQILTDKNTAEALARAKEAEAVAARVRAEELSSANAALTARVKTLESSLAAMEQNKSAQQQEIENLNLKLGELKKKLAKMVEIVNTNMKAYEKQ